MTSAFQEKGAPNAPEQRAESRPRAWCQMPAFSMTPDLETSWLRLPKDLVHSLGGWGAASEDEGPNRQVTDACWGGTGWLAPCSALHLPVWPQCGGHSDPFPYLASGKQIKAAQEPSRLPGAHPQVGHSSSLSPGLWGRGGRSGPERSQGYRGFCLLTSSSTHRVSWRAHMPASTEMGAGNVLPRGWPGPGLSRHPEPQGQNELAEPLDLSRRRMTRWRAFRWPLRPSPPPLPCQG